MHYGTPITHVAETYDTPITRHVAETLYDTPITRHAAEMHYGTYYMSTWCRPHLQADHGTRWLHPTQRLSRKQNRNETKEPNSLEPGYK